MFLLAAMPALAQSGVVEGSVVDALTKVPIAGAVVKLYRGDKAVHSGASDAQGLFRIDGVSHGQYRAVIDNSEHMRLASDHPAARRFRRQAGSAAAFSSDGMDWSCVCWTRAMANDQTDN
jgi:hypothetical protein